MIEIARFFLNRLSKILAAHGIASRRASEELIFSGVVKVNGERITKPQTMVDPSVDRITVNGKPIGTQQKKVYYLLNKPKGVLCTNRRFAKEKIFLDFFPEHQERLFCVGRLDKDTTGLLLVTNDGHFSQKIQHPSFEVIKEYWVRVKEELSEEDIKKLSKTVYIDGSLVKPTRVKQDRKNSFKICVKDGKKHEIRIITEKAGLSLLELVRVRIGSLTLGKLPSGTFRSLTSKELKEFS